MLSKSTSNRIDYLCYSSNISNRINAFVIGKTIIATTIWILPLVPISTGPHYPKLEPKSKFRHTNRRSTNFQVTLIPSCFTSNSHCRYEIHPNAKCPSDINLQYKSTNQDETKSKRLLTSKEQLIKLTSTLQSLSTAKRLQSKRKTNARPFPSTFLKYFHLSQHPQASNSIRYHSPMQVKLPKFIYTLQSMPTADRLLSIRKTYDRPFPSTFLKSN